jgi:hypothetical protein
LFPVVEVDFGYLVSALDSAVEIGSEFLEPVLDSYSHLDLENNPTQHFYFQVAVAGLPVVTSPSQELPNPPSYMYDVAY